MRMLVKSGWNLRAICMAGNAADIHHQGGDDFVVAGPAWIRQ
jgi:hypothetical protein